LYNSILTKFIIYTLCFFKVSRNNILITTIPNPTNIFLLNSIDLLILKKKFIAFDPVILKKIKIFIKTNYARFFLNLNKDILGQI